MTNDRSGGYRRVSHEYRTPTMEMPLFPLNVVLIPGMTLPLHIFEPRYLEMVEQCLDDRSPFGVVLIKDGQEVGGPAVPHTVGTAARITKVERHPDGRLDIVVIGARRFRIEDLRDDKPYLVGQVRLYPVLNGATQLALEQAQRVRPKIVQYVDLLTRATGVKLRLDALPEDPLTLAFLTAIALQVKPEEKQRLLALPGVPEMLDLGNYYLARELKLLQYMIRSQPALPSMTFGPTGALFVN